jgi:hypothetical protein
MYREKGIYVFRFFKNFLWRYVIVDSRIPCYEGSRSPIFAKSKVNNEFWVSLIEKAYAKLHGSYESLVSGTIDEGLQDMTGLASEKIITQDLKTKKPLPLPGNGDFGGWMKERDVDDCLMGCAINKDGKVEAHLQNGLIIKHAYGIIDVANLTFKDGTMAQFVVVRNPHGQTEWNGDWSD